MAGATLTVEWEDDELQTVRALFERLLGETDDLELLMRDIGEYLLPAHQDRILAGQSPDGTPFAPLDPDYKKSKRKRRSRGKDKILILDDFMRGELAVVVDALGLQLGTNKVYGATHQFGRGATPARPFLGLSEADIAEIEAIAGDFLDDLLGV